MDNSMIPQCYISNIRFNYDTKRTVRIYVFRNYMRSGLLHCVSRATNHIICRWSLLRMNFTYSEIADTEYASFPQQLPFLWILTFQDTWSSFIKRNEADTGERIFIHRRTIITYIFINFILCLFIRFILKYLKHPFHIVRVAAPLFKS